MTGAATLDFNALADEAGGLLTVHVISRDELPSLLRATMSGNARAAQLVRAVLASIDNVESAPKRSPMPCGACQRPVKHRSAYCVGVVLPDVDLPCRAVGFALCRHCCGTSAAADMAAIRAVRDVFPNARPIVITHRHGGRA
jgi:hypothetical protein